MRSAISGMRSQTSAATPFLPLSLITMVKGAPSAVRISFNQTPVALRPLLSRKRYETDSMALCLVLATAQACCTVTGS